MASPKNKEDDSTSALFLQDLETLIADFLSDGIL
jgi:hypothetical protein